MNNVKIKTTALQLPRPLPYLQKKKFSEKYLGEIIPESGLETFVNE